MLGMFCEIFISQVPILLHFVALETAMLCNQSLRESGRHSILGTSLACPVGSSLEPRVSGRKDQVVESRSPAAIPKFGLITALLLRTEACIKISF